MVLALHQGIQIHAVLRMLANLWLKVAAPRPDIEQKHRICRGVKRKKAGTDVSVSAFSVAGTIPWG
jgi:hypothetical protein